MIFNPKIIKNINFGLAMPAWQSKSSHEAFEKLIVQAQQNLEQARQECTRNILASAGYTAGKKYLSPDETGLLPLSPLFRNDESELSFLDDFIAGTFDLSRLAAGQSLPQSDTGETDDIESLLSDRYRIDLSKIGGLFGRLV